MFGGQVIDFAPSGFNADAGVKVYSNTEIYVQYEHSRSDKTAAGLAVYF